MWEKQFGTQETANAAPGGTTVTFTYGMSTSKVVVEYDSPSNRLRLLMANGDYVWSSEWLESSVGLLSEDMVLLIPEAAKHLQVLFSLRSKGRVNGLTPLELASVAMETFDHLLA